MIGKFLVRNLYPKADAILPNSKANAYDLKKYFHLNSNYYTIYNPVNIANILVKKEEEIDLLGPGFTFLMVGRFVKEKDHITLIEAFSMMMAKENCRLILLGHGPLKELAQQRVIALNLSDKVLFIDRTDNPFKYMSKAHCFVFSTLMFFWRP